MIRKLDEKMWEHLKLKKPSVGVAHYHFHFSAVSSWHILNVIACRCQSIWIWTHSIFKALWCVTIDCVLCIWGAIQSDESRFECFESSNSSALVDQYYRNDPNHSEYQYLNLSAFVRLWCYDWCSIIGTLSYRTINPFDSSHWSHWWFCLFSAGNVCGSATAIWCPFWFWWFSWWHSSSAMFVSVDAVSMIHRSSHFHFMINTKNVSFPQFVLWNPIYRFCSKCSPQICSLSVS